MDRVGGQTWSGTDVVGDSAGGRRVAEEDGRLVILFTKEQSEPGS